MRHFHRLKKVLIKPNNGTIITWSLKLLHKDHIPLTDIFSHFLYPQTMNLKNKVTLNS